MHFDKKNYLKNIHNHTAKHVKSFVLYIVLSMYIYKYLDYCKNDKILYIKKYI